MIRTSHLKCFQTHLVWEKHPKRIIGAVPKVKRGQNMDRELGTWVDEVMDAQQYQNRIFSKRGLFDWLRNLMHN
jgi:hypothetical protein